MLHLYHNHMRGPYSSSNHNHMMGPEPQPPLSHSYKVKLEQPSLLNYNRNWLW